MARSKILALSVFKKTFDLSYCDIIVMYESKKMIHYTVSKCPNTVKNFIKKHKPQFVSLTDNTYYHYYHYTFSVPAVVSDVFNLSAKLASVESAPVENSPAEAPTESPAEAPTESPAEAPAEAPTESPAEAPAEAPVPCATVRCLCFFCRVPDCPYRSRDQS